MSTTEFSSVPASTLETEELLLPPEPELEPQLEPTPGLHRALAPGRHRGERQGVLPWMKRKAEQAVVAAELIPLTNEGSRYGAFTAAEVAYPHNPLIGAAVLGGTTLLVEGAGALAAADILTDATDHKLLNWLNRKTTNATTGRLESEATMSSAKAITAYHLGTPAMLTLEQALEPDRTSTEVRRKGLLTASLLAGAFALEGAMISEGMDLTDGVPSRVATGITVTLALGLAPTIYNRIKSHRQPEVPLTEKLGSVIGSVKGKELSEKAIGRLAESYETFRRDDEAVKIGLYGDDLKAAYGNPHTTLLEYVQKNGVRNYMPLLVPAESLEWYNMDLLRRSYGADKRFLYYAHPPIPEDAASQAAVRETLRTAVDEGAVIFTDDYVGKLGGPLTDIAYQNHEYRLSDLGDDGKERNGQVFVTEMEFTGVDTIKRAPSLQEVYKQAVRSGEILEDLQNGVALHEVIEGEEAEKVWDIYAKPFERLTEEHPMSAGFDKDHMLSILKNPEVAKIVNRANGEITTIIFFQPVFSESEWFNEKYYQQNYPEYYDTDNIYIFPGIVTDETKRNSSYAIDTINLATKLLSKRGTKALVTFECTEVSATYIPRLVTMAVNHSGVSHIEPIKAPVSTTIYRALQKTRQP